MKKQIFLLSVMGLSLFTLTSCDSDDDSPSCVEKTWYQDADGDGLGNPAVSKKACEQPEGYVSNKDDKDDTKGPDTEAEIVNVTKNISENTTWTADKVYILKTRVTVLDGATLTIEPGTLIKGDAGAGANATALLVARGGKLNAVGTPEKPIIFTSIADNIDKGQSVSPNMSEGLNGFWGGVIILGKAPINPKADASEFQIEGIPTSDVNGLYGGKQADDNSGVIKYVSIRHGGTNIGEGNEINGLTLGGVGSGTTIENVEIVGNADDGVEFFGGSVSPKNILVWSIGDDALDTDQNWSGTLDGFVVVNPGDNAMELDGPEGSATPAAHTIKNGYIVTSGKGNVFNFDDNSAAHISNVVVNDAHKPESETKTVNRQVAKNGDVTFENVTVSKVVGDIPAGIKVGEATGFDFGAYSWTWASKAGKLK